MVSEYVKMAFTQIRVNKTRSFLTMLGIVIGIASVIAVMTVGESMNAATMKSMSELGANNIDLYLTYKEVNGEVLSDRDIKPSDYVTEAMFDDLKSKFGYKIQGIALSKTIGNGVINDDGKERKVSLKGVNGPYLLNKKLNIISGRSFAKTEYENDTKVIMISSKLAKQLFGKDAGKAAGRNLEFMVKGKYYSYVIVGVYEHKTSASDFGSGGGGTDCYLPLRTALKQSGEAFRFSDFELFAKQDVDASALQKEICGYLNDKYYANNDAFHIDGYSMSDIIKSTGELLNTLKVAMTGIAAISLLVGGIGVMNIMVVSITERTREIGIRKALGATTYEIRLQFIIEAIVMCVIGGIIGVILGIALGLGISKMMHYPGVPPVEWIVISVAFSVAFGVFFGFYPANKAAKMDPIIALSYE